MINEKNEAKHFWVEVLNNDVIFKIGYAKDMC